MAKTDGRDTTTMQSSIENVLGGRYVMNQNGRKMLLSDLAKDHDVLGVYFSAHWCPPCRGFTPKLKVTFDGWKGKGKKVNVVFVSSDRNQEQFDEYFRSMHSDWLCIPFPESQRRTELNRSLNTSGGIPCLIFLDSKTGEIHTKAGRDVVRRDPEAESFPWKDYQAQYEPPSIWNRLGLRLLIFIVFGLFYKFVMQK